MGAVAVRRPARRQAPDQILAALGFRRPRACQLGDSVYTFSRSRKGRGRYVQLSLADRQWVWECPVRGNTVHVQEGGNMFTALQVVEHG